MIFTFKEEDQTHGFVPQNIKVEGEKTVQKILTPKLCLPYILVHKVLENFLLVHSL